MGKDMVLEVGGFVPEQEIEQEDGPRVEEDLKFIESKEERDAAAERLAEHGLVKMREILGSLMDEITIFASTGMFLLGKKKREMGDEDWKTFHVAPGDLDGAVSSLQVLEQIRERLQNVKGVEFGHKDNEDDAISKGAFSGFQGQDAKLLAGRIPVEFKALVDGKIEDLEIPYEFELFHNTRVVSDADRRRPITYKGFKFLEPGALLRQYDETRRLEDLMGRTAKRAKRDKNVRELESLRQSPADEL